MTPADRSRRLRVPFLALTFAAATLALWIVSRGKWCDAVVDIGTEWSLADTLARGGLLYRDAVWWFGPFTPYFESVFFRVFGSSFSTLALAGVVGSVLVLFALYRALRRVTDRRSALAWCALAVPALVFMPYSGGSILAMGYRMWHAAGFSIAAQAVAARGDFQRRASLPALAGALAGVSGLCRTEWGVVTVAALAVAAVVGRRSLRSAAGVAALAGLAAAAVWGGTIAFFVWTAGADAVLRDGRLLLLGLPVETRRFLADFSGIARWRSGLATLLYSASLWFALLVAVPALAARSAGAGGQRRLLLLAAPAAGLLLAWSCGASVGGALFSAAPLAALASFAAGAAGLAGRRSAALAAFGFSGAVLSFRRPFDIRDTGYVAPPLLLAIVCAAALVHLAVVRGGALAGVGRRGFAARARVAVIAVTAFLFLHRAAQYRADTRVPIPGTGGMLSARPAFAAEIEGLVRAIRRATRPSDGLVVAPEGAILNSLSGRSNPVRYQLLIPGYLTPDNEADVIREFERHTPAAIVLWQGPTEAYGFRSFGEDYGVGLGRWIDEHYDFVSFPSPERKIEGSPTRLALRRSP